MKNKSFKFLMQTLFLFAIFSMVIVSCKKDPVAQDPIASFQYAVSESNYLEVTFTNYSQNATSYAWDFGDSQTSTDENPTHTFAAEGTYTVKLTASNADGASANFSKILTIVDPISAVRILTGDNSKDWRLLRDGSNAVGVSPDAASFGSWWALSNDGTRPCKFNHTWTFNTDGTFDFDDGGYMFGDDFVFSDTQAQFATCFEATPANMVNKDGTDISAWLSGTHNFDYDPTAGKLSISGDGAWIGMMKVTPGGDVAVPQSSIVYDIRVAEGSVCDTMVVSVTGDGWYWEFKLVSYDNPADEPDVVSFFVDYDFTVNDYTVTFENKSQDATSYSWDFGDGNTSTEANPTHTYAAEGAYEVVLTGTDATAATKTATKTVTISLDPTTLAPNPTEPEANVISIYSDAYTDIAGVNLDPDWGQATVTQEVDVLGEKILKMAGLNYQGIDWNTTPQNVSSKTWLHVDIYCTVVTDINLSVIGGGENPVTLATEAGVWKSFDIPLTSYTAPDLTQVIQVKFDDAGTGTSPTIFVDNIYFY